MTQTRVWHAIRIGVVADKHTYVYCCVQVATPVPPLEYPVSDGTAVAVGIELQQELIDLDAPSSPLSRGCSAMGWEDAFCMSPLRAGCSQVCHGPVRALAVL